MADSDDEQVNASAEPTVNTEVLSLAFSRNPTGKKTDDEVELALMTLIEQGVSVREAASQVGVNLRTAYQVMARKADDIEALRAVTRRVMAAQALSRMDDWRIASEVGARKKGNHAPARDWLLHAGVIDALESDQTSIRIAINIGTDDKPMRVVSPETIDLDPNI